MSTEKEKSLDNVAFKDFKNAITKNEFLTVLALAKDEYKELLKVQEAK